MAQDVGADTLDILRRDVAAPGEESLGPRGERQGNRGARAGSVADESTELQLVRGRFTSGEDDIDDVILHAVVDVDAVHQFAGANDLLRLDDRKHVELWRAGAHEVEDLAFLCLAWIADLQLQHKTVE